MEYALEAASMNLSAEDEHGLNPCFNGICSRSFHDMMTMSRYALRLNPCFNGICSRSKRDSHQWFLEKS